MPLHSTGLHLYSVRVLRVAPLGPFLSRLVVNARKKGRQHAQEQRVAAGQVSVPGLCLLAIPHGNPRQQSRCDTESEAGNCRSGTKLLD